MRKFKVNKYIQSVEKYLKERFGEIKPEWKATIFLLQDNLDMYNKCLEKIEEVGIFDEATYKKNPLIATLKDLQATILKEVCQLGLSPYAAAKIKEDGDNEDELIKALTGEDEL